MVYTELALPDGVLAQLFLRDLAVIADHEGNPMALIGRARLRRKHDGLPDSIVLRQARSTSLSSTRCPPTLTWRSTRPGNSYISSLVRRSRSPVRYKI